MIQQVGDAQDIVDLVTELGRRGSDSLGNNIQ